MMNCKDESPKLDLKLNLSPPRPYRRVESPNRSGSSIEVSARSSCVSSEPSPDRAALISYPSSPETIVSMVVVGCPRCLMYVMLAAEEDPKCPKCKSAVLLEIVHEDRRTNKSDK
ncbi:Protein GL2-INTERACTING REPRESSOR 1 [Sarracenia purpurea var. burkii]